MSYSSTLLKLYKTVLVICFVDVLPFFRVRGYAILVLNSLPSHHGNEDIPNPITFFVIGILIQDSSRDVLVLLMLDSQ